VTRMCASHIRLTYEEPKQIHSRSTLEAINDRFVSCRLLVTSITSYSVSYLLEIYC
jgi:hypothetical protein